MHYTLVLSPEGPTMLRMISSVHNLIPYMVIRQTLKVGNVATMLSGIVRVVLAKASMATVTNWMGLSSGADEGMNLLQQ
jgi:MFS superfamily sulfate permease-like transporter